VVAKGCQETIVPVKRDVLTRDTRISRVYAYNVRWTSKLSLLSLIATVNNDVYQQQKIIRAANKDAKSLSNDARDKLAKH
jgi:hypothetical protein